MAHADWPCYMPGSHTSRQAIRTAAVLLHWHGTAEQACALAWPSAEVQVWWLPCCVRHAWEGVPHPQGVTILKSCVDGVLLVI